MSGLSRSLHPTCSVLSHEARQNEAVPDRGNPEMEEIVLSLTQTLYSGMHFLPSWDPVPYPPPPPSLSVTLIVPLVPLVGSLGVLPFMLSLFFHFFTKEAEGTLAALREVGIHFLNYIDSYYYIDIPNWLILAQS